MARAAAPLDAAFAARNADMTRRMAADREVRERSREWVHAVLPFEYHYHFTWLGLPIIQFPSDIVAMQEVIWEVQPDLIIETGIARGGSLVLYASMLELLGGDRRVVGIDVDIREHTRTALAEHPLRHRITTIEGSSIEPETARQVTEHARSRERVLVVLGGTGGQRGHEQQGCDEGQVKKGVRESHGSARRER